MSSKNEKAELRAHLKARLSKVDAATQAKLDGVLADFAAHPLMLAANTIAFYWPMPFEADPRALMAPLRARGKIRALPCVVASTAPLEFRAHGEHATLTRGVHGIFEPASTAPLVTPDVVLVPLLGFDGDFYRLGRGGGYYDRTIATLCAPQTSLAISPLAIGLGFACQEVASVPREVHDAPLDGIITERGVLLKNAQ